MTNEWHRHPSERDASQCDPLITVPPRAATARVNQSAAGAETPTQSAAVALPSGSCRYSCRCRGQRCCFARWAPASTAPASHPATAASLGWQRRRRSEGRASLGDARSFGSSRDRRGVPARASNGGSGGDTAVDTAAVADTAAGADTAAAGRLRCVCRGSSRGRRLRMRRAAAAAGRNLDAIFR